MVEVRPALAEGNLWLVLELEILAIPLADGGEGTTEARVEGRLGWLAEARAVEIDPGGHGGSTAWVQHSVLAAAKSPVESSESMVAKSLQPSTSLCSRFWFLGNHCGPG